MLRKIFISTILILCTGVLWAQTQPQIGNQSRTICSGTALNFAAIDGLNGDIVPAGTTYSWNAPTVTGGLTGGSAATYQATIPDVLTLLTNQVQTATYLVTPTANGVTGAPFTLVVTINPYATAADINITVTAQNAIVCGGLSTTLNATSSTVINPTFNWFTNPIFSGTAFATGATINSGTLNTTTDFYVQVTGQNACLNKSGQGKNQRVTVSGIAPTVDVIPNQVVCSGNLTTAVTFTSPTQGIVYTWTNDNPTVGLGVGTGLSSTGIPSFQASNGTNALITANITVTPSTTTVQYSCVGVPQTFTIQVGPIPVINNALLSVCSGSQLNYAPSGSVLPLGTTYTWAANSVPGGIAGVTTQNVGQSVFNPTLFNTTLNPIDISFTVTPKGPAPSSCSGNSFTLTVTVNPTPQVPNNQFTSNNLATASCSGTAFAINPTNVPANTTYKWLTVPQLILGSYNGATAQATPQVSISQIITNNLAINAIVEYDNIIPTSTAGCAGNAFSVTVTIYPQPKLTNPNTTFTVCNNLPFSFSPNSATTGITYNWTRAALSNINNSLPGNGTGDINETLSNTSNSNLIATYQYTLSANGCNNTQNIQVTIKPTLSLASDTTAKTVCSNSPFAYTAVTATTGTTLNWTRVTVSGIGNSQGTGINGVNERLVNTSNVPVNVVYQFRNTSGLCSDVTNITVVVNPLPTVNTISSYAICSGFTATDIFTGSSVANTAYNWTNSNANIGLTNSGDSIASYLAYDATYVPINGTITVTPVANGCNGQAMSYTITVNPAPTLSSPLTIPAVCGGSVVTYSPTGYVNNTQFTWSRPLVTGITNAAASGTGAINEIINNGSNIPLQVPYNYTLTTTSGCTALQLVNITVNPLPSMFNPGDQHACNNTTKVVNFSGSIVSGTSYVWTNDNINIGIPAAGTGDIFFVASSSSTDSVYANIVATPQAYGCSGQSVGFKIIITPTISLLSSLAPPPVCSNALFIYTPSTAATNPIYTWTRGSVNGISNAPAAGSGSVQEILVNTTTTPLYVTYNYTISSNGCVVSQNVVAQVNPALVLNNLNNSNEVCSGSLFNFSPIGNITGLPYLWSRDAVAGITNPAGTGTGDINDTLYNITNSPIVVLYHYSLGQGTSCAGDQVISLTVKPLPSLTSSTNVSACSNLPVAYTPLANIPGTNFNWSRAVVPGISNTASVGVVGISESLINTTTLPVNAIYTYSMTNYNGCSNTQLVTVQVNPSPIAAVVGDQSLCADDITQPITFSANLPNTSFTWTNSEPGIGLASSGTGATIPAFKSTNTTSGQLVGVIQVTPITNGCAGNVVTAARITVNRAITSSFIETQPSIACAGQVVGPFVASIPLGGDGSTYVFQWQISTDSVNFTNIVGGTARQLIAPPITQDSWFRMTTVSLGCKAVTPQIKIPLKPKPVITVTNRDNFTISIGNSTQLVASGANTYLWSPTTAISDFTSPTPLVSPIVDTKYTVLGTTIDGCSDSTSVTIKVIIAYAIYPNNILTPNGDGFNDTWKIKNIEYYPVNSVKVYNINSIKVWDYTNYKGGWTGVFGSNTLSTGLKLASGTYYYIITLGSGAAIVKGALTILN